MTMIPKERPVSDAMNRQNHGKILSRVYQSDDKEVARLREKHEDYLASLPNDPSECIRAAGNIVAGVCDEEHRIRLVRSLLFVTECGLRFDDAMHNKPFADVLEFALSLLDRDVAELEVARDILNPTYR